MRFERRVEWLRDIVENCDRVTRHVAGMSRASFLADEKTCDAVERCLQRICEAAKRLKDNERVQKLDRSLDELYPTVPWSDVRGMGDILRHDYDSLERDLVWDTLADLAPLRAAAVDEIGRLGQIERNGADPQAP